MDRYGWGDGRWDEVWIDREDERSHPGGTPRDDGKGDGKRGAGVGINK